MFTPSFIGTNLSSWLHDAYIDGFNDGNGYLEASILSGTLVLGLNGLQVSPNYLADDETVPATKIRWAYDGNLRAILSNPTEAKSFRRYDSSTSGGVLERHSSHFNRHAASWSDDRSVYPIPEEYIKDLIDRVVATEVSISTKVTADELRDNVDTTKVMQYGAQVQR